MTNGHLDIAARACAVFDELVIGVYRTPPKTYCFHGKSESPWRENLLLIWLMPV